MVEKINVEGALHVADALWSLAPQAAFLQMSTGYVYGERATPADEAAPLAPLGVYACSKAVAERELLRLAAGRRLLCVRAFNHIGPGQGRGYAVADWARALAAGAPSLQTGGLDAVRDLSDVRELASALARLVRDPDAWPPVLNLCAGVSLSMRDVLGQLFAVHGGRAPRVIEGDAGRSGLQQSRGSRALADRLGMPRPRPLRQTLADVLAAAAP
jgi:GDP-4-dehydro-6-deoxy-D-mannose reductase